MLTPLLIHCTHTYIPSKQHGHIKVMEGNKLREGPAINAAVHPLVPIVLEPQFSKCLRLAVQLGNFAHGYVLY